MPMQKLIGYLSFINPEEQSGRAVSGPTSLREKL
jgi:hypothetical protein